MAAFADHRYWIERLVEREVMKGEAAPVISESDNSVSSTLRAPPREESSKYILKPW